jgi:sucrose synthase
LCQVRALEKEMVARAEAAGVPDIQPRILVLTRLIPDARGTSCDEPYERISGTEHAAIVRIPFHDSQCASLPKTRSPLVISVQQRFGIQ